MYLEKVVKKNNEIEHTYKLLNIQHFLIANIRALCCELFMLHTYNAKILEGTAA